MGEGATFFKIMLLLGSLWALLCIFREFESTDHGMKYRRNLYIIWVCEPFNVFVRTSEVRYDA
jgi:hypothetical protein